MVLNYFNVDLSVTKSYHAVAAALANAYLPGLFWALATTTLLPTVERRCLAGRLPQVRRGRGNH